MHKRTNGLLLAGILFAATIYGAEPLIVVVHNYADVELSVLERAESEAARILGTAGGEINWVNCLDAIETTAQCRKPPDSTELVLHLLPAGTTRRDAPKGALGFALPPESGPFASYGGVLYDRVERLSGPMASKSVVLGHAMAHELGHLLLGVGRHAPSGIMMSQWRRRELHKAAQGTLVFRAEDRLTIEENIRRRFVQAANNRLLGTK